MSLIKIEIAIPEANDGSEPAINLANGETYLFGVKLAEAIRDRLIDTDLVTNGHISQTYNTSYKWEGERYERDERTLTIKATSENIAEIVGVVQEMHPYMVPGILVTDVHAATVDYNDWVEDRDMSDDIPKPGG